MSQFLVEVLLRTTDLALVAVALSGVYGLVKFPNIALVQYASAGALGTYMLAVAGLPLALAIPVAVVLVGVLAVLLNRLVFDRLLRAGSAMAMIGSLAVSMLFMAVFMFGIGTRSQRFELPIQAPIEVLDARVTAIQLWTAVGSIAVLALLGAVLFRSDLGRQIRATACSPALAMATGINAERITHVVVFASGALAALGGVSLALRGEANMQIGTDLLLPVFAAAILGGLGNPIGALAGAALIALAETIVTSVNFGFLVGESVAFLPIGYVTAASFLVLVLTLLVRPRGLFGQEVKRA